MVTDVDICNIALQNIGGNIITSLTEGSPESDACNLRYDIVRKTALELHPWNFATKRAALNLEVESPAFGYTNQFALPSDFLRMVATDKQLENHGGIGDPDFNGYLTISNSVRFSSLDDYKIETNSSNALVLLSNDDAKSIVYIYNCEEEGRFSGLFVEFMAKLLGAAIAYRITGSNTVAREEKDEAIDMLMRASGVDAKQGTYERQEVSTFIASRF